MRSDAMPARTLFDKVWDEHVVDELAPGIDLLHIDRHMLHDLGGGDAIAGVLRSGHAQAFAARARGQEIRSWLGLVVF